MTATVLIVDDLEQNIKLLEAKLLSEYYTVLTANNGVEALNVLSKNSVDIVLLDIMMAGMDGLETCRRIKTNPETTHIPVVMVTALSDIEDRINGLEAGADEFLTKPINDTALFARVKSLTRMKTVIDELKLRNKTNEELGNISLEFKDNFSDAKVLLLDDDIAQVRNIRAELQDLVNQIKIISNSKEIDALGSFIPDLIIISCQLDNEDPLRIGIMLRSKPMFKNSVIMLLGEDENMPIILKGMELGINDYFIYPVDKSELQARVKTQLRRKKYQDNLRTELEESVDLSTKDGLTGVFNRRYFDIHIKQMTEKSKSSGQQMCLMMIDMDHFKEINDKYGHISGDKVLKDLTVVLKSSFRVTDLIARYGGEEFAILLGNASIEQGKEIAEKIRTKVEEVKFVIPTFTTPLKRTISIGIAEFIPTESIEEFINRADKALYIAKSTGRNKAIAG